MVARRRTTGAAGSGRAAARRNALLGRDRPLVTALAVLAMVYSAATVCTSYTAQLLM